MVKPPLSNSFTPSIQWKSPNQQRAQKKSQLLPLPRATHSQTRPTKHNQKYILSVSLLSLPAVLSSLDWSLDHNWPFQRLVPLSRGDPVHTQGCGQRNLQPLSPVPGPGFALPHRVLLQDGVRERRLPKQGKRVGNICWRRRRNTSISLSLRISISIAVSNY